MDAVLNDVRYTMRNLARAPGFTAIAVLTLAIGIGATTAIFSAVYAVVLKPFPFPEPDRVVAVREQFRPGLPLSSVSPGNFEDWRTHATSFSALGARRFVSFNVSNGNTPERLLGVAVTPSYFSVFRVPAAIGRTFTTDESRAAQDRVVILSHRLWTRMFGADAKVVGQTTSLDGHAYTVVGVMPEAFDRLGGPEDLWIPAVFTPEQIASHDGHSMSVFGRLASGVSMEQASGELSLIYAQMKAFLPDNTEIRQAVVNSYSAEVIGNSRQRLLVLFGAVALVMLIACGNVAHLLLARGSLRASEVALRASLGASRRQLIQQFLTESLVLAIASGTLGVAIAYAAIPTLLAIGPEAVSPAAIPRLAETTISGKVLLFALAAAVLSAVVSGILPALRAAQLDLRSSLNEGSRSVARARDTVRSLLVAAEVALAVVLVTGAGLMIRSALYLQTVDPGFDDIGVVTARISLPQLGYEDPLRVERAFGDLVNRLSQHPNVEAAAVSSSVPMIPAGSNNGLLAEGKVFNPNDFVLGRLGVITDDYFRTFRIRLLAGRTFDGGDRRESPKVMILSETAARLLFPGQAAVGKRVACCEADDTGAPVFKLVVGVVSDVRADGPQRDSRADFYLPDEQAPEAAWTWFQRTMTVVVRGQTTDPSALAEVIRTTAQGVERAAAVHDIATMQQRLRTTLAADRFNTVLMSLLGGIGLVLAAIGIYGVISCFVVQRRHELAIRLALGAHSKQVVRMVVGQGMRPVWVGVLVGLVATGGVSRALATSVYGVTTRDPLSFVLAVLVLLAAALLANVMPARAAARVDPATLLVR